MSEDGISCSICREHFKSFVNKNDINLIVLNKKNLLNFFRGCHNEVNRKQGNKKVISYDEVIEFYSKDIVKGSKKYKWEDILSVEIGNVEQDGHRCILITKLFRNQELNSFPELFTKTFNYEYNRIYNLINNNEENHLGEKENKIICNNCQKKKILLRKFKNKMRKLLSNFKYF